MKRWTVSLAALWPALGQAATLEVSQLGPLWALPFVGILLSIALCPLWAPHFWHRHFGKVALGWALMFLLPLALSQGPALAAGVVTHTLVAEYLPFTILLVALFTVSGGIYVRGNLHGSPGLNTGLMALGAVLASFMGTTGASMLLIRPLIRANDNRRHAVHVIVFFIFIVSNAGGSLTPLGDPPLFLGFLQGVSFFWTVRHVGPEMVFVCGVLLAMFYGLDSYWYRKEGVVPLDPTPDTPRVGLDGMVNLLPLALIVGLVLLSGVWKPGVNVSVLGQQVALQSLVRDAGLLGVTALSLQLTPRAVREANQFSWGPMAEVAKLFVGIFITMAPVLVMLQAGVNGPFADLVRWVSTPEGQAIPLAYFWLSGWLSAFLDNAPTYLVFFNLAGGEASTLMTQGAQTLAAISAGSVFMGAMSYIGNAPNFMVKAIAEDRGLRMPSFFGYMGWSFGLLLPVLALMSWVFFA
ncbi:sodium:proton antiporter [Inhella gelatinilytica]|uniref:Sodium:proton antiporter n=1 Tax=Inhella gelatinilytica TaxID=2795030 RepID=A0A931IXV9_9BURK|nr:sodium:proton antiporter [Inhella gelatinilytica]MBH9554184.1 sodium:proton antiporter [Inhella gelatinilytica]